MRAAAAPFATAQLAEAAGKLAGARQDVPLKDTEATGSIIGKPLPRLDTAEKTERLGPVYAIDVKLPDMLLRRHRPVPGVRRQAREASTPQAMHILAGVSATCSPSATTPSPWSRTPGTRPRRHSRSSRSPGRRARTRPRSTSKADRRRGSPPGWTRRTAAVGHKAGRRAGRDAGEERSAPMEAATYGAPFLNHAHAGTAELRLRKARRQQARGLGRHAERGRDAGRGRGGGRGCRWSNVRVNKYLLGGGFGRRGQPGLRAARGADREAGAGPAGQADLVPRGGHAATG